MEDKNKLSRRLETLADNFRGLLFTVGTEKSLGKDFEDYLMDTIYYKHPNWSTVPGFAKVAEKIFSKYPDTAVLRPQLDEIVTLGKAIEVLVVAEKERLTERRERLAAPKDTLESGVEIKANAPMVRGLFEVLKDSRERHIKHCEERAQHLSLIHI